MMVVEGLRTSAEALNALSRVSGGIDVIFYVKPAGYTFHFLFPEDMKKLLGFLLVLKLQILNIDQTLF